jgi:preprotein translocase subunit YajC
MPGPLAALPVVFAQGQGAPGGGTPGAGLWQFLPYIVIIGLWFYLLLIRPQQKQERERRQMLEALKKNDRVLTTAGIYGTVVSVDGEADRVVLRIGEDQGVRVAFTKGSIVRIMDASTDKDKEKASGVA